MIGCMNEIPVGLEGQRNEHGDRAMNSLLREMYSICERETVSFGIDVVFSTWGVLASHLAQELAID